MREEERAREAHPASQGGRKLSPVWLWPCGLSQSPPFPLEAESEVGRGRGRASRQASKALGSFLVSTSDRLHILPYYPHLTANTPPIKMSLSLFAKTAVSIHARMQRIPHSSQKSWESACELEGTHFVAQHPKIQAMSRQASHQHATSTLYTTLTPSPLHLAAPSQTRSLASAQASRGFATSVVARRDLIQEAYLRELKAYKPAAKVRYHRWTQEKEERIEGQRGEGEGDRVLTFTSFAVFSNCPFSLL